MLKFGVVVIGRNEGDRLKQCISSLSAAAAVVYVDSGSTDGSAQWSRARGVEVVDLDTHRPFTAARARNAGFRHLCRIAPELRYVQFVDGDCELREDWPEKGLTFLGQHSDVAVVCGRRRERHPERSVYNWLCDTEWDAPAGEALACGGDAMMRIEAVSAIGGYRDDLIAGEEPELCVRLRATGWRVWRLDAEMTWHDASITRFTQWWRRSMRSGYAFAAGVYLHGAPPERHWVWESRRAWMWGALLPLACLGATILFHPWGGLIWLAYPLQATRQAIRNKGSLRHRATLALFQTLSRFPEAWGQIAFFRDRLYGLQPRLIEYK